MNLAQYYEEQDAWFSRADRFDGFDRGDIGRGEDPGNAADESPSPVDDWEDIPF